jgi:cobalt-zinc-cadmium efflux system outer membrane protein
MRFYVQLLLVIFASASLAGAQSVSDQLRQRTGLELPPGASRDTVTFSLPPGITSTTALSARDAIAIALWNNADLQADLATLDVSRADLTEAAQFKNPSFSTLLPVGPKPFEFLLAWPIEELWQRKQRVKAAQLNVDAVATGLVQNGLNLIRDVRLAYTELWFTESRSRILQESSDLRGRIAAFAQRRRDAGDGTGLEVSIAQADAQSNAELARIAVADVDIARDRLRYLLGMRGTTPALGLAATPLPAPQPLPALSSLIELAASNRPDLRAAEVSVQAAAERAKWQRSQVIAMLAPTLSIKEVGSEGLLAGPGLNMEIPILSRNEGRISRADAEVVRAGKQYAALRARIEQEVADARNRALRAQTSLTQIQQQVRPPVDRSIELSQRAYENGDISLLNVLEATRQRHDINLREAEAAAALQRALSDLERAVGRTL